MLRDSHSMDVFHDVSSECVGESVRGHQVDLEAILETDCQEKASWVQCRTSFTLKGLLPTFGFDLVHGLYQELA